MKNPNPHRKTVVSLRIHPFVAARLDEVARRLEFSRSYVLFECICRSLTHFEARFGIAPLGGKLNPSLATAQPQPATDRGENSDIHPLPQPVNAYVPSSPAG